MRVRLGPLATLDDINHVLSDLSTVTEAGARIDRGSARIEAGRRALEQIEPEELIEVFDLEPRGPFSHELWRELLHERRLGGRGWPFLMGFTSMLAEASPRFRELRARHMADDPRLDAVRVESIRYTNPLEIALGVVLTGAVIALLRTIRDWPSERRTAGAEADIAEAQARAEQARARAQEAFWRQVERVLAESQHPLPSGWQDQLLAPEFRQASVRLAAHGLEAEVASTPNARAPNENDTQGRDS